MDNVWPILIMIAVAVPVFLLLRWIATKRAVEKARRRRDRERGGSDLP
ncbi:hypothetical protein [Ornithinimicrobium flavum]|nr:hypothetical protein [Ornithinimicrobium flavum]